MHFDDLTLNQTAHNPPPGTQWNIVWSDEFNGSSINGNNWTFETGNNYGWGNQEREYYTGNTNNAYVDGNGFLHIAALQQSMGGFNFTSARMKTEGLYGTPTYGRVQWRAAMPAGFGMWPALWMMGTNESTIGWPACGEMDVMENNGNNTALVQGSLHYGTTKADATNETGIYNLPGSETTTNFHIYELDWSATCNSMAGGRPNLRNPEQSGAIQRAFLLHHESGRGRRLHGHDQRQRHRSVQYFSEGDGGGLCARL